MRVLPNDRLGSDRPRAQDARVIRRGSQLSSGDDAAIAGYVASLPPVEAPPRPKKMASKEP